MLVRLALALAVLSLPACAAHEAPPSGKQQGPDAPPEQPRAPHAELSVAVASVTLQQDCPDPPEPVALAPDGATQPASPIVTPGSSASADQPPPPTVAGESPMQGKMAPGAALARRAGDGPGGWSPPCIQSTLQLALGNTGDAPGTLEIQAIRLLDAASKRPLGTLEARRPGLWSETGTYQKWDQRVLPGAALKTSYSLGEPDWSAVQTQLGAGVNLYTTPFVLELDVAVDGAVQTVRSPEFLRQEVHMIVT